MLYTNCLLLLYCCSKIAHGSKNQKIGCAISHTKHKTQFAHRIGMYVGGTRTHKEINDTERNQGFSCMPEWSCPRVHVLSQAEVGILLHTPREAREPASNRHIQKSRVSSMPAWSRLVVCWSIIYWNDTRQLLDNRGAPKLTPVSRRRRGLLNYVIVNYLSTKQ